MDYFYSLRASLEPPSFMALRTAGVAYTKTGSCYDCYSCKIMFYEIELCGLNSSNINMTDFNLTNLNASVNDTFNNTIDNIRFLNGTNDINNNISSRLLLL